MPVPVVGVDLSKSVFQLSVADATDILNRLFSIGHAHNETPLPQSK